MRIIDIAYSKIKNGKVGSAAAVFLAAALSFTVFAGFILSSSMSQGTAKLRERLGADMAVVPSGQEAAYQGVILSGEPVECSMDRSVEKTLLKVDGIDKITPVVYIASLSAACCSAPVQIVGYDPETDFVTSPWISEKYASEYESGSLVVGCDIAVDGNKQITFFGRTYNVRAKLNKTGTGMDKSVYATFDVIEGMLVDAREKGVVFGSDRLRDVEGNITDSYVSAFLIQGGKDADTEEVARSIVDKCDFVSVVQSRNMLKSVASGIGLISKITVGITLVTILLVTLASTVLHVFRVSVRKREWAVYRMMGASGNWIIALIFSEVTMLALAGVILGIGAAALVVFPFSELISLQIKLPYYEPGIVGIGKGILLSLAITLVSGIIPGIISGMRATRYDCYELMREGGN